MHPARKGWRSLVEYEEALVLSQLVLLPVYIYQYIFFSFWNYRFHCCIIICKKVSILWCLRSCWIFGGVEYVINMEINSHVNQFTTWNFCVVTLCLFNLPSRIMSYISRDSFKDPLISMFGLRKGRRKIGDIGDTVRTDLRGRAKLAKSCQTFQLFFINWIKSPST